MTDHAPIDAKVVARILRRAGDLERAGETPDESGTIAEQSLLAAAEEVGLSVDAVRRSIAVERLGPPPAAHHGDRLVGRSQVYADGEVDMSANEALVRVDSWLVDGHHLRRDVLRSGHGEWSKRSGLVGVTVRAMRNATGEGRLGDVERVSATARDAGSGSSVVRVTIDRTFGRRLAGGGGTVVAVGVAMTGVAVAAVTATPVLLLAAIGLAFLPAREYAVIPTVVAWTLLVLAIEAAARRHLVGYLLAVLVLAVVLVVTGAFVVFVVTWGWRYVITGTFWGLAAILLFANVQELGRD